MWNKNYKKIDGIVLKTGTEFKPKFKIDFDKLSEITNHYGEFVEKVKEYYELEKDWFKNIVVYTDEKTREGKSDVHVFVALDNNDTHICLFGCSTNHEKYPFIFEFDQNKSFVSMMANLL